MKPAQRIKLKNMAGVGKDITGTIAGMGHITRNGEMIPIYTVELDDGFYNPENTVYVQFLVVHRDNLLPIE